MERTLEPLSGLDAAFLAMETPSSRLHVAGIFVLDPPVLEEPGSSAAESAARRFDAIRTTVGERLGRVPRLSRRPARMPLDLQRPVWAEVEDIDLDAHVRPASVASPGGQRELDALAGGVLSQPLPLDRPLWEMVVADGLSGGRTAVVARLHHAVLDGVSGAAALAAFLDLGSAESDAPSEIPFDGGRAARSSVRSEHEAVGRRPPVVVLSGYLAASLAGQAAAAAAAFQRSADALVALRRQNRELARRGLAPPPAPFSAPRTCLNGSVPGDRRIATFSVPLADLELVRHALGRDVAAASGRRDATVNDVILAAVGGALRRYLASRGQLPSRSLVALVPVSTRAPAAVSSSRSIRVGNDVSGMLVELGSAVEDPVARLRAVARATGVAKMQENLAGGAFVETLLQAVPPILVAGFVRMADACSLFDRISPPANVVVSSIVVPDVPLWWAGCRVSAIYPAGPVADGIGLNVTAMTYQGVVSFGVVGCPRLVPDVGEVATLLAGALAELVAAATVAAR